MKNIVQLVSLMADQLESTPEGREQSLLAAMRSVVPTLQQRSERFLSTLSNQIDRESSGSVNLREALQQTAEIHELDISIEGDGVAAVSEQSFNSIVDNLFGNYADQWRRNPASQMQLSACITCSSADEEQAIALSITDRNGSPCVRPERLFEPFWSEKGDGLGIGLYHARQLANAAGGALYADTPADRPINFVVKLPVKQPEL
jgi:C4-dicarboxylate-specific signal transduction histidine kinase